MCDKAVNIHPSAIQFVSECFKTQEMCDEDVDNCLFHFILFLTNVKLKKCVIIFFLRFLYAKILS